MPTISTEGIEGFESMTAEQKVEALLKVEVPEKVDLAGYVKKDLFDKTASELAEAKKAAKAKMSEEEQAAAERDAKWAEMEAKLQALEMEKTISTYKASYLAMNGYDEKLAQDTAEALAKGDMAKVFANQQKAMDAHDKALKAELLRNTPKPEGAGGGDNRDEDPSVELARKLGKEKAASMNVSAKGLEYYIK